MDYIKFSKVSLIKLGLWCTIFLSGVALVYHIRWLLSLIFNSVEHGIPNGQSPVVWFLVQIFSNIIFLIVSYLVLRLFNRYEKIAFFDRYSLKVFDAIIISCLSLAILGTIKLAFSTFNPIPLIEYKSVWGIINLMTFFIIDTVTFKEPQTMYFILTLVLWAVKQFITKALSVKSENESFI